MGRTRPEWNDDTTMSCTIDAAPKPRPRNRQSTPPSPKSRKRLRQAVTAAIHIPPRMTVRPATSVHIHPEPTCTFPQSMYSTVQRKVEAERKRKVEAERKRKIEAERMSHTAGLASLEDRPSLLTDLAGLLSSDTERLTIQFQGLKDFYLSFQRSLSCELSPRDRRLRGISYAVPAADMSVPDLFDHRRQARG